MILQESKSRRTAAPADEIRRGSLLQMISIMDGI